MKMILALTMAGLMTGTGCWTAEVGTLPDGNDVGENVSATTSRPAQHDGNNEPPKCAVHLEVVELSPPVITKDHPGSQGIKLGLEGGCVLKIEGSYHLFTAEMVENPWWKKMRLGHWTSPDRVNWARVDTIMESSGDFTGTDLKANVWAPMPFYDEKAGVWNCYYIAYRAKPNDSTGWNLGYDGRVIRAVSQTPGPGGFGGPWRDVGIALEPAWEPWKQNRSQPWEGLQGTDSMSPPYRVGNKWLAFYGSAQTQSNPNRAFKKWSVGLAEAPAPTGPWKRCDGGNPMPFGNFAENPIVMSLPDGSYLLVCDGGETGTAWSSRFAWSPDGVHWSRSEEIPIPSSMEVWWKGYTRTPLGCIPEPDGTYTMFFMANPKGVLWQALGYVRVKINRTIASDSPGQAGFSAAWTRVAYDDAGVEDNQPHLIGSDGNCRFENHGADGESLRTCAFGQRVEFGYGGLNPRAQYKAKLRFFSDRPRELRVKAGEVVLLPVVKLEPGKIVEHVVNLPVTATLTLALEKISGPNAVVSDVEILSTDAKPLTAYWEKREGWIKGRPRYIARPTDTVSLNGQWTFCADGPAGANWKPIEVPGEWVMQGFQVKANCAAGYRRTFTVPASFAGQRVILRFDGVYSEATIMLNDKEIGRHIGGFTPFEFDVTDTLRADENLLALAVKNESIADKMSAGTWYAGHPLGGIPRKVTMFAVPALHIAGLEVTATPDETLTKGIAHVVFQIVNAGKVPANSLKVTAALDRSGGTASTGVPPIAAGDSAEVAIDIPVEKPALWDTEHPNLYTLTVTLSSGQTIQQRIGFKRVEVRGNQLFVNTMPVKLRGGCRHETHPTRGRSLTPDLWRRDAELYREANFNLIRTAHYPPPEEFITACDELGLFIECESPMWQSGLDENNILQATIEMVQACRNHPSVLFWSLANEAAWCDAYYLSSQVVKKLDPLRPQTFEGNENDHGNCSIGSRHYPASDVPKRDHNAGRPIHYGEFCHLSSYSRFELSADPSLRDTWGRGFRSMWDAMFQSQGTLGGALWAAMDDTFHLPDGRSVGFGEWGILDNWRRPKPEYWHCKKTYSPVRIDETQQHLPVSATVDLPVLNQCDFSNMREFDISWSIGRQGGKIVADIAPHAKGTLRITPKVAPHASDKLMIEVRDPRGFVADEYAFTFGEKQLSMPVTAPVSKRSLADFVSRDTGRLIGEIGGPTLMVLPLNGQKDSQLYGKYFRPPYNPMATKWEQSSVDARPDSVTVVGEYAEAKGTFRFSIGSNGELEVAYSFTMKQAVNPRQVGLVFDLPRSWATIAWHRNAPYTVYPSDHIGRPVGTACAFGGKNNYEPYNLRNQPTRPWCEDATEGGTHDFRSTKENIFWYQITDSTGHGVRILSDGKQHARAWVDGDKVRLLVADYSNAGGEVYFHKHVASEDRPLRAGDDISGLVRLLPVK